MTKTTKNYLLAALMIATIGIVSCGEEDDDSPAQSITVSTNTIDLGEVISGTVATSEFTISATQGGTLDVTGDDYSLDVTEFLIPGVTNTVTISFSPASDAPSSSSSATITITVGDLTETISVTATVKEPEVQFLASGTSIYSNMFTFASETIEHGDSLIVSDLDLTATVLDGVTAEHTIINYETVSGRVGATYQINFSLCDDSIVDGTAASDDNDNDFSCGGAISIQGTVGDVSTSVEFKMTGLLPSQPAVVTYWVRPHGNNERGFDASFTGGETVEHRFDNTGDTPVENFSRTYTRYDISGTASENGELSFKVEAAFPADNSNRGNAIDNVSIVVP